MPITAAYIAKPSTTILENLPTAARSTNIMATTANTSAATTPTVIQMATGWKISDAYTVSAVASTASVASSNNTDDPIIRELSFGNNKRPFPGKRSDRIA